MKKVGLIFLGMIAGIVLAVYLLKIGADGSVMAASRQSFQQDAATLTATLPLADEGLSDQTPEPTRGADELDQPGIEGQSAPETLATPVPGETQLYFVPTDNDATATIIYLYNTDAANHVVALRGYSYNGVLVYSLNINVPAGNFVRLASDFDRIRPAAQLGHPSAHHHQLYRFHLFRQPVPAQGGQSRRVHPVQSGHRRGRSAQRSGRNPA